MSDVVNYIPCVSHRIFFIRHGETVDNVAGLYAGIRDSPLTVHGVQQATRLAEYFAREGIHFTNTYSSDLTRAVRTAEAVLKAQPIDASSRRLTPTVMRLPELREQDFGFYEGKPFYIRSTTSKAGRESHYEAHQDVPGIQAPETKQAMGKRANKFLDEYLLPLLHRSASDLVVAVVSHGMLLSSLWKCILRKQSPQGMTINPELLATSRPVILEHLGGWSNTGYLEILLRERPAAISPAAHALDSTLMYEHRAVDAESLDLGSSGEPSAGIQPAVVGETELDVSRKASQVSPHYTLEVRTINGKAHLQGLRRTGGGVGSSKFDGNQQSIKSFFKKQKKTR